MELKASSPKPSGLSPSDGESDPEEKEISDEDDDDRNHKHRRRETRSQSLERDALEQVLSRPYKKRNKPFENGHSFRENDSQSSGSWKNYNMEKDLSGKFEKRRPGLATFARAPSDPNQRMRVNQLFSGDIGPVRGRGKDPGSWNQRDSRFCQVDIASQMVQQGSMPGLYAGRGLQNVSNAQSASWSGFGLLPGIPNGGLDSLHSLGLQGTLRPPINSSLNKSMSRKRCRDFEERGFCLRGDMCPMEHGVNRIVVEDVQSLSQFNLPVSLPSAHLMGTPAGPGSLSSVNAPPSSLMNSKGFQSKSGKPGVADDDLGLIGAFSGSAGGVGPELYDPDQPLWNNDCPETPSALLALHSPKVDETESLMDANSSDRYLTRSCDGPDNGRSVRSTGTAVGSQSANVSVWGRIGGTKDRLETKEKIDSVMSSSDYLENEVKEDQETLTSAQGTSRQGKRVIVEDIGPKTVDLSPKTHNDPPRNIRKPSQKALRTLFVNGIPQKNNRKEALLSHFRKFGEVIDIYIPLNSERAFVQFSKREEAEAALQAPDAVMGNRFIKLWWANRDSVPDDSISGGNSASVTPHGLTSASVPSHPSVANKGKDNIQSVAPKVSAATAIDAPSPLSDHSKPIITNGPKAPPPLQKKLESLELMKEELRKKQEMLDQKRNDFRRQLDKLEKQATGLKGEVGAEQAAKRLKVGIVGDATKAAALRCTDPGTAMGSSQGEITMDKNKLAENVVSHSPKANSAVVPQEPAVFKQSIRPLAPGGTSVQVNRYKLDNRPTAFRISAPLPTGLGSLAVLKEHFSSYGDLSVVELEDVEAQDGGNASDASKNYSARITFTTRRSAEKAFVNGKCWQGHNLHFMWLVSSNCGNELGGRENSPSALKGSSESDPQPTGKLASSVSQDAALSGNGEPQDSESKSSIKDMEHDEVIQSSSTLLLLEEKSPNNGVC